MTKTISLPISTETCNKIKKIVGITLWILATAGMIITLIGLWYDWWNSQIDLRVFIGTLTIIGSGLSIICLIKFSHDSGVWINFKCNCEANK